MTISSTPATTTSGVVQYTNKDIAVGDTGGTVGFFGTAPVAQPTAASVTDYASLKVALQALGLIGA
jgi:hypothetical protein